VWSLAKGDTYLGRYNSTPCLKVASDDDTLPIFSAFVPTALLHC
jgi:hypothetical protein